MSLLQHATDLEAIALPGVAADVRAAHRMIAKMRATSVQANDLIRDLFRLWEWHNNPQDQDPLLTDEVRAAIAQRGMDWIMDREVVRARNPAGEVWQGLFMHMPKGYTPFATLKREPV